MSYKPSKRESQELEEIFVNLNPMMDMFAVLIPALLMLSAVVEISVINISAPSIGPSTANNEPPPDKPPLNLTLTITSKGYTISSSKGIMPNTAADGGPTLPLIEKQIMCSRYRGYVPPPRARNLERGKCDPKAPLDKRNFLVYDNANLTKKVVELKNDNPTEYRIIIAPEPGIDYETIIDALDATRDTKEANGDIQELFNEVVISPAVQQ